MGGQKPGDDDAQAATLRMTPNPEATVPASRDSQPVIDMQPGSVIGRYRLVERLGSGAMGVVWSAQDPQLDRKVAIKLVHPSLARTGDASKRLLREARAMAKLSHRAVVTVHDAGEFDGRLFLAMEHVDGTNLGQMLRNRTDEQRRDWRKWLAMMLEAGRGLEAAHGAGVLHRDFKPDNVLVSAAGRVCVGDFGLATLGEERPAPISERASKLRMLDLTTTGALLGTPAYMSPQQLRGEAIDARADQFNFCVATYEAVYGKRPFEVSGTGVELMEALEASIERGDIPTPESDAPPELFEAIKHGLAPNPDDRWPSMTALLRELEEALRPGKRTQAHRAIVAKPKRWPLVVIAALLVAVGALSIVVVARRPAKKVTAKRLFDVSFKAKPAITRDGKRIAIASDRIEVRELDGTRVWTSPLPAPDDVSGVFVDNNEVLFGVRRSGSHVQRWRYAGDNQIVREVSAPRGAWLGRTIDGDVFYDSILGSSLQIVKAGLVVHEIPPSALAEALAVSPNGKKIAVIEADRFTGRVAVYDVASGAGVFSPKLDSPTALAWQDDERIVYATGTTEQPRIWRARVAELGKPEMIYGIENGWFGDLAVGGGRMVFVEMGPKSHARVIDRGTQLNRELDSAVVAAGLAWTANDEFLTWSRGNHHVERRTVGGKIDVTPITLPAEPANATIAGDTLIVAVRGRVGREIIAHSLLTGAQLWALPAPTALVVRCAGDRKPPCFALRRSDTHDQLVTIDPATGALGDKVLAENTIEDLAVDDAGERIMLAIRAEPLRELAIDGTEIRRIPPPFVSMRSIAYDHDGTLLATGTLVRNTFQVGRVEKDGQVTIVSEAENDMLSLVRPSYDSAHVLVLARLYAPVLWELDLPP